MGMIMKIKEIVERSCCDSYKDWKDYKGLIQPERPSHYPHQPKFCIHCGQIWIWERKPGEMEYGYGQYTVKDE